MSTLRMAAVGLCAICKVHASDLETSLELERTTGLPQPRWCPRCRVSYQAAHLRAPMVPGDTPGQHMLRYLHFMLTWAADRAREATQEIPT